MQNSFIKRKVRCVKKLKKNLTAVILSIFDKTIWKNEKDC